MSGVLRNNIGGVWGGQTKSGHSETLASLCWQPPHYLWLGISLGMLPQHWVPLQDRVR